MYQMQIFQSRRSHLGLVTCVAGRAVWGNHCLCEGLGKVKQSGLDFTVQAQMKSGPSVLPPVGPKVVEGSCRPGWLWELVWLIGVFDSCFSVSCSFALSTCGTMREPLGILLFASPNCKKTEA